MIRQNPKGDWKKAHKKADEILELCLAQDDVAKKFVENWKKIKALSAELYEAIPSHDTLYGDSPISHTKLKFLLNAYLKKLGMDGINSVFTNVVDIKDFADAAEEALKWAFKFEKTDKKNEKAG